jgi:hypothetical protein
MRKSAHENVKNVKIIAFTILESIFVLLAVAIISIVLAGLLLKNSKLPAPESVGNPSETTEVGPRP